MNSKKTSLTQKAIALIAMLAVLAVGRSWAADKAADPAAGGAAGAGGQAPDKDIVLLTTDKSPPVISARRSTVTSVSGYQGYSPPAVLVKSTWQRATSHLRCRPVAKLSPYLRMARTRTRWPFLSRCAQTAPRARALRFGQGRILTAPGQYLKVVWDLARRSWVPISASAASSKNVPVTITPPQPISRPPPAYFGRPDLRPWALPPS